MKKRRRPRLSEAEKSDLVRLVSEGMSALQIAAHMGRSHVSIYKNAQRLGVVFKRSDRRVMRDRDAEMCRAYQAGEVLAVIGARFGVTRERVRQVVAREGIARQSGGVNVRAARRKEALAAARDDRFLRERGCTYAQWKFLLGIGRKAMAAGAGWNITPLGAYANQRHSAKRRGIEWNLTLWQWWTIWQESGHWEGRGRGRGYVMCRTNDTGPYAVGNVRIALAAENSSEANRKSELPIGVRHGSRGKKFVAQARIDGRVRWLGTFDTPDEAHIAYQAAVSAVCREAA